MHSRRKHLVSGVHLERADNGLEEVYHVLVLLVVRAVAGNVERRRAGSMLGELVRPEDVVRLALADPVLVHWQTVSRGSDSRGNAHALKSRRSMRPKPRTKVSTEGPLYGGTTVPSGSVAGDGSASYCLERSQYWA